MNWCLKILKNALKSIAHETRFQVIVFFLFFSQCDVGAGECKNIALDTPLYSIKYLWTNWDVNLTIKLLMSAYLNKFRHVLAKIILPGLSKTPISPGRCGRSYWFPHPVIQVYKENIRTFKTTSMALLMSAFF